MLPFTSILSADDGDTAPHYHHFRQIPSADDGNTVSECPPL